MENINGLELCAGIGGLALGLQEAFGPAYRTVCWIEKDSICQRILESRMRSGHLHDAPIWDDLQTFDGRSWKSRVHAVSGGFPCQPFSTASRGRRVAEDLWPEVYRIIGEVESPLVLLENVPGAPWTQVTTDLRSRGYVSQTVRVLAGDVGAPHRRSRVFLVAYSDENSQSMGALNAEAPFLPIVPGYGSETSRGLGVDDGLPSRLDRLQRLGNAVVPQAVEALFR